MGLGRFPKISLQKARKLAVEARQLSEDGVDPIEQRRAEKIAARLQRAGTISFRDAADRYIKQHAPTWKNKAHRAQWKSTIETYANPVLGDLPVSEIRITHVLAVLEPLWHTRPETAGRLRGRIEKILSWAAVRHGLPRSDNPAAWKGNLDAALPPLSRVRKVKHQPALDYAEIPAFIGELREKGGVTPLALEMTVLCATRTIETIGARWPEIDLQSKVWTVPASRMKSGRLHRVPLTSRALQVLKALPREDENDHVFIGGKAGSHLSNMAMLSLLKSMRPGVTVHGMRASFKTWARQETNFAREVSEACLAHVISDATEAAYVRDDLFQKRRKLMTAWAKYCEGVK